MGLSKKIKAYKTGKDAIAVDCNDVLQHAKKQQTAKLREVSKSQDYALRRTKNWGRDE